MTEQKRFQVTGTMGAPKDRFPIDECETFEEAEQAAIHAKTYGWQEIEVNDSGPRCFYCGDAFEDVDPQDFTLGEGKFYCGCELGEADNADSD